MTESGTSFASEPEIIQQQRSKFESPLPDRMVVRAPYKGIGITAEMYFEFLDAHPEQLLHVSFVPTGSEWLSPYYARVEYDKEGRLQKMGLGNLFDDRPDSVAPLFDFDLRSEGELGDSWTMTHNGVHPRIQGKPFTYVGRSEPEAVSLFLQFPYTKRIKELHAARTIQREAANNRALSLHMQKTSAYEGTSLPSLIPVSLSVFSAAYDVLDLRTINRNEDTVISIAHSLKK